MNYFIAKLKILKELLNSFMVIIIFLQKNYNIFFKLRFFIFENLYKFFSMKIILLCTALMCVYSFFFFGLELGLLKLGGLQLHPEEVDWTLYILLDFFIIKYNALINLNGAEYMDHMILEDKTYDPKTSITVACRFDSDFLKEELALEMSLLYDCLFKFYLILPQLVFILLIFSHIFIAFISLIYDYLLKRLFIFNNSILLFMSLISLQLFIKVLFIFGLCLV